MYMILIEKSTDHVKRIVHKTKFVLICYSLLPPPAKFIIFCPSSISNRDIFIYILFVEDVTFILSNRRYMAEILPIRLKTLSNQSINQSTFYEKMSAFLSKCFQISTVNKVMKEHGDFQNTTNR